MSGRVTREAIEASLGRYREIVGDWEAFCDALARPLPSCVWTNTLLTTPEALVQWFERCGVSAQPLSWCGDAFTLQGASEARAGTLLPFLSGLCHIQEEASLLASAAMRAQPGERVLDMCAAPGGKTAHMAVQMRNTGTLVANDRAVGRLRAMSAIIARLGLLNVTTMAHDATRLPRAVGRFDRVLADVPCSCEGTSRKNGEVLQRLKHQAPDALASTQQAILTRALKLARPGGHVIYSTCAYAPEENELVVQGAMEAFGRERVALVPLGLDFVGAPGLDHWGGRALDPSLRLAMRVYPHQLDTGGFFIARLQRLEEPQEER